jgi:hypothetical protein
MLAFSAAKRRRLKARQGDGGGAHPERRARGTDQRVDYGAEGPRLRRLGAVLEGTRVAEGRATPTHACGFLARHPQRTVFERAKADAAAARQGAATTRAMLRGCRAGVVIQGLLRYSSRALSARFRGGG